MKTLSCAEVTEVAASSARDAAEPQLQEHLATCEECRSRLSIFDALLIAPLESDRDTDEWVQERSDTWLAAIHQARQGGPSRGHHAPPASELLDTDVVDGGPVDAAMLDSNAGRRSWIAPLLAVAAVLLVAFAFVSLRNGGTDRTDDVIASDAPDAPDDRIALDQDTDVTTPAPDESPDSQADAIAAVALATGTVEIAAGVVASDLLADDELDEDELDDELDEDEDDDELDENEDDDD